MSITFVRRSAALTAIAALSLALSACSGNSDDASPDPTVTADSVTEAPADASTDPTTSASVEPTEEGDPTDLIGSQSGVGGRVCNLLDNATIEAITGLPFGPVVPTGDTADDKQTTCEWSLEGDNIAIVQVLVMDTQGSTLGDQRTFAESMFDDVADAEVEGVGDAFTYMGGLVVAMEHEGDYVQVMYMSAFQPDTAPLTLQLANEVIGNR